MGPGEKRGSVSLGQVQLGFLTVPDRELRSGGSFRLGEQTTFLTTELDVKSQPSCGRW